VSLSAKVVIPHLAQSVLLKAVTSELVSMTGCKTTANHMTDHKDRKTTIL